MTSGLPVVRVSILSLMAASFFIGSVHPDSSDPEVSLPAAIQYPPSAGTSHEDYLETLAALERHQPGPWTSLSLSSSQSQWLATGLEVQRGRMVSVFGFGERAVGSIRLEPRNIAWLRIGEEGEVQKLASNQFSFRPSRSGELFLTIPPPFTIWENPQGRFPDNVDTSAATPLGMNFIAVEWTQAHEAALEQISMAKGDVFHLALERLRNPKLLPEGFSYLWFLGQSDVFERFNAQNRFGIRGHAINNWGIVKKPLDLPLRKDSEISFEWLYSTLPAHGPETDASHHDYLSVAVEFDNGQDITWFWSSNLEVGTGFRCPLPWWNERETHIVLQSGQDSLGEWHAHRRNIREDYKHHVGDDLPNRIIGVWFIATSLSQTPAVASFAGVKINQGGQEIAIFDASP